MYPSNFESGKDRILYVEKGIMICENGIAIWEDEGVSVI